MRIAIGLAIVGLLLMITHAQAQRRCQTDCNSVTGACITKCY